MNTMLTLSFWGHLIGLLAIKIMLVLAMAGFIQKFVRSAVWRRTLWRAALLCVFILVIDEVSRLSQTLIQKAMERPAPMYRTFVPPMAEARISYPDLNHSAPPANWVGTNAISPLPLSQEPQSTWWPGYVWLGGIVLWGAQMLFHGAVTWKLWSSRASSAAEEISELARDLAKQMGIQHPLRIVTVRGLASPMAFGWRKPSIGLPEEFQSQYTPTQQAAVLAHELAHIKAGDPVWHGLGWLVVILCWWHPLVWWGHRQHLLAAELAADEASRMVKQGPDALAECLVKLAQNMVRPNALRGLGADGHGFRSGLGQRIQRLLDSHPPAWHPVRRSAARWVMVCELAGFFVLANGLVTALAPQVMGSDRAVAMLRGAPSWNHSLAHAILAATAEKILPEKLEPSPIPESNSNPASIGSPNPAPPSDERLIHRSFRVDHGIWHRAVRAERGTVDVSLDDHALWKELAEALKVQLAPPRRHILRADVGVLSLRLYPSEMEVIAQKIQQAGAIEITDTSSHESSRRTIDQKIETLRGTNALSSNATHAGKDIRRYARTYKLDPAVFNNLFGINSPRTNSYSPSSYSLEEDMKSKDLASRSMRRTTTPTIQENVREVLSLATGIDIANGPAEYFFGQGGRRSALSESNNVPPKATVFYNDRTGILYVNTTLEEQEAIERFIQIMNTPRAQISIETKLITLPESLIASIPLLPAPGYSTNVLLKNQATQLLSGLKRQASVEVMNGPKLTTVSGRQAQVQAIVVKPVTVIKGSSFITNLLERGLYEIAPEAPSAINGFETVSFDTGPTIDLVPYLRANQSIQLNMRCSVLVFAGYGKSLAAHSPGFQETYNSHHPSARLWLTQFSSQAVLWSGQSVICGPYPAPLAEDELPSTRPQDSSGRRVLYCIATVLLIDPTGEKIDGEWDPKSIPEQEFY